MTRIFFSPSSQAMLRAICSTAALELLYDTQAWPYTGSACKLGHSNLWEIRTLLVILPDIDAIRMMLPPRPKRDICLPAACAVKRTPLVLTSRTFKSGLIPETVCGEQIIDDHPPLCTPAPGIPGSLCVTSEHQPQRRKSPFFPLYHQSPPPSSKAPADQ